MTKDSRIIKATSKVSAMLLEQSHFRVLKSESWIFPIQQADIQMKTVVRSQMDVLMKMILMIVRKLEVKQPSEISELLTVESIFIEHMLDIMVHSKMVEIIDSTYRLTPNGLEQLQQGTFAHNQMEEQVELTYSPFHNDVLIQDSEHSILEEEDYIPDYTFDKDVKQLNITELEDATIRKMIEESGYEFIVEQGQKVIEDISSVELQETLRAVCIEFHMHDSTEDIVFIRVWNTWTGKFDIRFEDELNQKKAKQIRVE